MKERPNKSQQKRESAALQLLGEQLAQLNSQQLASLPIPAKLLMVLQEVKRISSHGAKKRQFQFIGGVIRSMKSDDVAAIQLGLNAIKQAADIGSAQFHNIEKWRDRLLSDEVDVLTEFLHEYPSDDIQQLRQLISKAKKEQTNQKKLGGATALFRFIKSVIVAAENSQ